MVTPSVDQEAAKAAPAKVVLVREVIECSETQLVPLLHRGGIELLPISRATPYSLVDRPKS